MSRREDIDNAIWSDPDFLALTPPAKLTFVWSFTNQRCGMSGLYKVVPAAIEMETGMNAKQVSTALAELAQARFAFFDGNVLWVRSRIKRLRAKNPNIRKAIERDLEDIGPHDLAFELCRAYAANPFVGTVCQGFLERFANGSETVGTVATVTERSKSGRVNTAVSENSSSSGVVADAPTEKNVDPEHLRLSHLLAELMLANDDRVKVDPDGKRWLDAIRLLNTADKRTVAEIEQVIRWSQADEFWKANIHSAPTLREKFPKLLAASQRNGLRAVPTASSSTIADEARSAWNRGNKPQGVA